MEVGRKVRVVRANGGGKEGQSGECRMEEGRKVRVVMERELSQGG